MANPNKVKGSTFERKVVNDLKRKWKFAKTTRLGNKDLDNCGIDIDNIPYLIQCKKGYDKIKFDYEKEFLKTQELLKLKFPPESDVHTKPYIFIHSKNGTQGKQNPIEKTQVIMTYDLFLNLLGL